VLRRDQKLCCLCNGALRVSERALPYQHHALSQRLWCKVAQCWIIAAMAPAESVAALFKGRQFDQEIIVLCVRWYLRYKLSTRDLVEMMAERGAVLVHTTILRWVQHYVPEFEKRDAYAASHRAVQELKSEGRLPRRVRVRSNKYLNNMIEQDHRRIRQRTRPMLGFKRLDNAAVTISGIELVQKIQKHQFKTGKLGGCSATMPELWNAVLAARSEISEIRRRTAR
jgi:transposase-like protein